jgi:hypothetical protein
MIVPRLRDVIPELADELRYLFLKRGESALADQVANLQMVASCRCSDPFCSSFYTAPPPTGSYGPGYRGTGLWPQVGMLNVDVVESKIVHVEVLYRDEFRDRIRAAAPQATPRNDPSVP